MLDKNFPGYDIASLPRGGGVVTAIAGIDPVIHECKAKGIFTGGRHCFCSSRVASHKAKSASCAARCRICASTHPDTGFQATGDRADVEHLPGTVLRRLRQYGALSWILKQAHNRPCQSRRIARTHQYPRAPFRQELRIAANPRCHHGASRCHCFKNRERKPLGQRGENIKVKMVQKKRHILTARQENRNSRPAPRRLTSFSTILRSGPLPTRRNTASGNFANNLGSGSNKR